MPRWSFNYLYYNGAVAFNSQIKEMATSWEQAGIKLNLEGKSFGDVIGAAFARARPASLAPGTSPTGAVAGIYSPDYYPTGEEIFATGAGSNAVSYSDPDGRRHHRGQTNVSSSLSALYDLRELPRRAAAGHLAAEPGCRAVRGREERLWLHAPEPLLSWAAENWYFCKASQVVTKPVI